MCLRLLNRGLLRAVALCWLGLGCPGQATINTFYNSGFVNGKLVPDGDLSGWADTRNLSGLPSGLSIDSVKVTLSLSGGYNGDLYAYLSHDGQIAVLLNRIGRTATDPFGYGDPGMDVLLSDGAPGNVHLSGDNGGLPLSGSWQPDARTASPLDVLDSSPLLAPLGLFHGVNPGGDWTLFVADVSGGEQTTVESWGLQIEATGAPLPDSGSAVALLGLAGSVVLFRRWRVTDGSRPTHRR